MPRVICIVTVGLLALMPMTSLAQDFLPFGPTPGEAGIRSANSIERVAEAMRVNGISKSQSDRDSTMNDYESRLIGSCIIAFGLIAGGALAGRKSAPRTPG